MIYVAGAAEDSARLALTKAGNGPPDLRILAVVFPLPRWLLALRDHQTLFERYLAIAMGAHFAIRFLLLLGFAEHLDGDVLSSLLLHLGFVSAFLTRSRLGPGVLAATFSIRSLC